jgi:DNA modification methylase
MAIRTLIGDCRDILPTLASDSVHCVVTSPPYWGLRDYGVDGQIGLEPTIAEFVAEMVAVFREVRRVLRQDGVMWLNLGDSYATGGGKVGNCPGGGAQGERWAGYRGSRNGHEGKHAYSAGARGIGPMTSPNRMPQDGLKPKDLCGIPWKVAQALQEPYYTGRIKTERDRVWLAAIIDGEGTICGTAHTRSDDGRTRTAASVFITNSCERMLNEAHRIWPASRHEHCAPSEGHLGIKVVNRWIAHSADIKALLLAELYPYFVSKKQQAMVAWNLLQFQQDGRKLGKSGLAAEVRAKRELLCSILSDLNHGRPCIIPSWCKEPPSLYEPGWYLRQDIIWAKPNPMPESVTDRCTKSHEYIFLLSKSERYYYDPEAIREMQVEPNRLQKNYSNPTNDPNVRRWPKTTESPGYNPAGRNKRSVWTVATAPFSQAHFATFPPELIEPCIKAGTSEKGCCAKCGAPWQRKVERTEMVIERSERVHEKGQTRSSGTMLEPQLSKTIGWMPSCLCYADLYRAKKELVPATILDPFGGAGTTGLVADRLQRNAILIELNPKYAEMADRRIFDDAPLLQGCT